VDGNDEDRRRRPRRRDAEASRQALLDAGTTLFAERGYEVVPVWAIAHKAGVNRAMVSYYFGGKRKLYLAIVLAAFEDLALRAETLAESREPAPVVLRKLIEQVADAAARRHPHFPAMMLREAMAGGRHLDPQIIAYPLRVADVVRRVVERGIREGAFRAVDPLLTHLSLIGALLFFFATARLQERVLGQGRLRARPPSAAEYVTHVQELFTHGLAASAEARQRRRADRAS
jgi:TetR/AcrR family transcriptional regulator